MIRSLPLVLCAGLVLSSHALVGCGDNEGWPSVQKESGEAWDAAKTWGVARRQDAESLLSESLGTLRRELDAVTLKARTTGGAAAHAWDSKWADVSGKFSGMQAAGADRWDEAREAFVRAYEALARELSQDRQP